MDDRDPVQGGPHRGDRPARNLLHLVLAVAREIGADLGPRVPLVRRPEHFLGGRVEHAGVVGRQQDRQRVEKAVLDVLGHEGELVVGPDGNIHGLPRSVIDAIDAGAIGRIDDAAVGLHGRLSALAARNHLVVHPRDGALAGPARRRDMRAVVLRRVQAIRHAVVDRQAEQARGRLVVLRRP